MARFKHMAYISYSFMEKMTSALIEQEKKGNVVGIGKSFDQAKAEEILEQIKLVSVKEPDNEHYLELCW